MRRLVDEHTRDRDRAIRQDPYPELHVPAYLGRVTAEGYRRLRPAASHPLEQEAVHAKDLGSVDERPQGGSDHPRQREVLRAVRARELEPAPVHEPDPVVAVDLVPVFHRSGSGVRILGHGTIRYETCGWGAGETGT